MTASGEVHEDAVRSGLIPKNVITRSLGPNPVVRVDLEGPFPVQKGDRFLLCSDGLTGPITDEELGVLMQVLSPGEAVQVMVDLANLRGGPDNITAIVVDAKQPSIEESNEETTDNTSDDPLRGFSAPLLSVAVVCIAAAAAFAWFALWPLAIIVTVLGIVAVSTAVYQYQRRGQPSPETRYRLGKGPYRKYHCVADQEMVSHFTQIIQSLREAAEENRWTVRWPEIEAVVERGNIATSSSAFNEAVRNYALAIKQIMQQVRESDTKMASDSSIEY
jgi:protein phosphatase